MFDIRIAEPDVGFWNLYGQTEIAPLATMLGPQDQLRKPGSCGRAVLKAGQSLTGQEVIAHCNQHMASFKAPKRVEFADSLPKNPSGKLVKRELRQAYGR